ncbi:20650_t:CDS:2 [Dentiscutata erythropus]|uniref:20650_t:CDS:1 n=1 Tax=Dentiscutata erythropus TaxID=1348616 RepID=A0A9N8VX03_9GLOM|nr:20650_t:CDS:2 [Dentiscutata erythropus]
MQERQATEGIAVTPKNAKCHIISLLTQEFRPSYPDTIHNFKASDQWLDYFMNQFDLSLRRRTKASQKLLKDLCEKIDTGEYKYTKDGRMKKPEHDLMYDKDNAEEIEYELEELGDIEEVKYNIVLETKIKRMRKSLQQLKHII